MYLFSVGGRQVFAVEWVKNSLEFCFVALFVHKTGWVSTCVLCFSYELIQQFHEHLFFVPQYTPIVSIIRVYWSTVYQCDCILNTTIQLVFYVQ